MLGSSKIKTSSGSACFLCFFASSSVLCQAACRGTSYVTEQIAWPRTAVLCMQHASFHDRLSTFDWILGALLTAKFHLLGPGVGVVRTVFFPRRSTPGLANPGVEIYPRRGKNSTAKSYGVGGVEVYPHRAKNSTPGLANPRVEIYPRRGKNSTPKWSNFRLSG